MSLVRKLSAKSALLLSAFLLLGGSAFAGETAVEEETAALSDHSKVAAKEETAGTEKVVEDWMVPVPASDLKDGVYEVNVESSSSMFKITSCTLTVENGEMSAEMTMGGSGYAYVYMGTGEEAAAAADEDLIPAGEDAEGHNVFTVPVEALDAGTDCAAFSKKKEQWYDRAGSFPRGRRLPCGRAASWRQRQDVDRIAGRDHRGERGDDAAGGDEQRKL